MRHRRLLAILVLLLLPVLAEAQVSMSVEEVAGRVLDTRTGQPLAHALVTLQGLRARSLSASTYSDDEGRYRFQDHLASGKYRLEAQASGHRTAAYLEHGLYSTAIVLGSGLATNDLVLRLEPDAVISGRVTDENGDAVPHATVSLFRQTMDSGRASVHQVRSRVVADDGSFEFAPLLPGRYFLAARGTPWYAVHPPHDGGRGAQMFGVAIDPALDVAYPTVFYPEARTADGASPLDLTGGEEVTANLRLQPEPAVTLTIRRTPGSPSGIPPQLTEKVFDTEMPVAAQDSVQDGLTVISGLAPGRYGVRSYTGNGNRLPTDEGTVDLTGGSVTRNAVPPGDRTTVTVLLRPLAGETLPKEAQVTLLIQPANGGFTPSTSSPVDAQGKAEFTDVPPGQYRVRVAGNRRRNLGLSGLRVDGKLVSPAHLMVGDARHLEVAAQLAGPVARVEGFAKEAGRAAPACMIVLVPAGGVEDSTLFRRDQSDLDGSFNLEDVVPGRYLLVALKDAWALPWTDVHVLEPYLLRAVPVVVPADGGVVQVQAVLEPQQVK